MVTRLPHMNRRFPLDNTQRSDTDKATYFGLQLLGILFIQH